VCVGILAIGGYLLFRTNSGTGEQTITVKPSPAELIFQIRAKSAVEAQVIDFGDAAVGYEATTSDARVSVSPPSGDRLTKLTVKVNSANLNPGTYDSSIQIKWRRAKVEGPATIPVHVIVQKVASAGVLAFRPKSLEFAYRVGDPLPPPQAIALEGAVLDSVSSSMSNQSWAKVQRASNGFRVSVQPNGLTVGTFNAVLTLKQDGRNDAGRIPIALTITPRFSTPSSRAQEQLRWTGTLAPGAVLSITGRTCSTGELSAGELPGSRVEIDTRLISGAFRIEARPTPENRFTLRIRNVSGEPQSQLTVYYREAQ
jgi:hypothetical protein